jgi:hypothetical protein
MTMGGGAKMEGSVMMMQLHRQNGIVDMYDREFEHG